MDNVNNTIGIILWLIYSAFEGEREAYYYDLYPTKHPNIHWIYFLQRGIVLVIIGWFMWSILLPLSLAFMFPLLHDGFYYMKRNDLNKNLYPKRFRESSTTSEALMEFSYKERVVLAIASVITLIIMYLIKWI